MQFTERTRKLGVLSDVFDSSGYWEERDTNKLISAVDQANSQIARLIGVANDTLPSGRLDGAIRQFPDFEHLEAKGQQSLERQQGEAERD